MTTGTTGGTTGATGGGEGTVEFRPDPDKLTLEEAAAEFGVTVERIRNWYRAGVIRPYSRPADGKRFVSRLEIQAALTPQPMEPAGEADHASER